MRAYPKIEICSPDGRAMYVTIDGYVFYIDNTTNEQIMDCWKETIKEYETKPNFPETRDM